MVWRCCRAARSRQRACPAHGGESRRPHTQREGGGGGGEPWVQTSAASCFPHTRAADAALVCLTLAQNNSKTWASISLCLWCSSGANFPLRCFLQEFQCPGLQRQGGGCPHLRTPGGTGPLCVLGTLSSWDRYLQCGSAGGFSPGAIALRLVEAGEQRICLFSSMTELVDYIFSTVVTDLR